MRDHGVGTELRRAAAQVPIDADRALARFHAGRRRRRAVRRSATMVVAVAVAVAGLGILWTARPTGRDRIRPLGSAPTGTIAYMHATHDGSRVALGTLMIGGAPTTLVDEAFVDYPVWSPDATSIAYGAGPDYDHTVLTVANADGTSPRRISDHPIRGAFAWSPDGLQLAYIGDAPDGVTAAFIVDADGQDEHRVIDGWWQSISWSPDGSLLLLAGHPATPDNVAGPEGFDLYTVRTDGTRLERLTKTLEYEHFASWSPDGSRILFTRSPEYDDADYPSDVYSMSADGSGERRLTDWGGFDSFPVWSPDGDWIAFTSDRDASPDQQQAQRRGEAFGNNSLYVMRSDGGDARRVLSAGEGETIAPTSWRR